jgi:hypothetical protein
MAERKPEFYSADGNPVYRELDESTQRSVLIVVMPDGKAYYADSEGRPTRPMQANTGAGALLGGLVGLLWGPWGAVLGATVGAILAGGGRQPGTGRGGVSGG